MISNARAVAVRVRSGVSGGQRWLGAGLLIWQLIGAPAVAADALPAQLWLAPRSCVLSAPDTPCVERIRIRWLAPAASGVCVWLRGAEQPVFCESRSEGERELLLPIPATTQFDLKAQASGPILATVKLLVMTGTDDGKRRRYQHPWSIF